MAELVWIHRTNANELGISQTENGTGRGSFFLVPTDARKIFFPNRDFDANPDISESISLHFIDKDKTVTVSYSKPASKSEHRLSLAGLSEFIGNDKDISPNKLICFYRKGDVIHFATVRDDSIYGHLLNEFPARGRTNNLVTQAVFDKLEGKDFRLSQTLPLPKPFLILAGVSGTGKSRFVREQVAQAERQTRYQLVAVRPDWHEPSDLLGYVSRLSGSAQYVMTDVLKFIVKAWQAVENAGLIADSQVRGNQAQLEQLPPYWLCLDEMNLAPVEQYFADYLSVLESREWKWSGDAFSYQTEALLAPTAWADIEHFQQQLGVSDALWAFFQQNGIGIPLNLMVAGTVNMDETTHAFSRKVLDRALSFDFSEFYPNDFSAFFEPTAKPKQLSYPIYSQLKREQIKPDFAQKSIDFLTALNQAFEHTPFKLGFRALNELLLSVQSFQVKTDIELQAVWDDFVMMKVLPRLEGDEVKIGDLLDKIDTLLKIQLGEIWDNSRPDLWREPVGEKDTSLEISCRTRAKLTDMKRLLATRGIVSFWS